jgi:3-hydroxybutyryl-CoA dehydrogenase
VGDMSRTGIARTAVIGAGLMGHGIAQVFAENGCSVALYDIADTLLAGAMERIRANLALYVELGHESREFAEGVVSRIRTTTDLADAVKDAQYVTEAIPEDLNLKVDVFRKLDAATEDRVVLTTNTSTLSITAIATAIKKSDRVIITHWFNPPHLVPVVEVVKGESTSQETFELALRFLKEMGKDPVHVLKQVPGFLVNRIQTAMFREVVALLEEEVASAEDIDKAVQGSFGLRLATMGPLAVADLGGVDLWYKGAQNLYPSLDASKEPRRLWTEMVEKGDVGAKTGRGFFNYEPGEISGIIKARDVRLLAMIKLLYPRRPKGDQ